jgi:hypothetical protein
MSENGAITWTNERRKLRDLVPWERNPREINKREAERLGESLAEFGQIQTIAIGPNDEVYDGHQRKLVWSVLPQFGPDYEVDVRVSSRPLTEHERQKLVVFLHRGSTGYWDWDRLANEWEMDDLLDWGFSQHELGLDYGEPNDPNELWEGMPEFEREQLAYQSVHIHFKTLEDLQVFSKLIDQEIGDKTKSLWFPPTERRDLKSMAYITDES